MFPPPCETTRQFFLINKERLRGLSGFDVEEFDRAKPRCASLSATAFPHPQRLITDYGKPAAPFSRQFSLALARSLRRFYFRARFPCISRRESRTRPPSRTRHSRESSRITPAPMRDCSRSATLNLMSGFAGESTPREGRVKKNDRVVGIPRSSVPTVAIKNKRFPGESKMNVSES